MLAAPEELLLASQALAVFRKCGSTLSRIFSALPD